MNTSDEIWNEIKQNQQKDFELGSYLYLGMANKQNKKVCIAVAYTLSYCIKKSNEFLELDSEIDFLHISKIKNGEKQACEKFYIEQPLNRYY